MTASAASLPRFRTGGLGILVAILNMLMATAGLAWLAYGMAMEWNLQFTAFEEIVWHGMFGLALVVIFISAIVTLTGAGWGFVLAAGGHGTAVWIWLVIFQRWLDPDLSAGILTLEANLFALVVLNRFIWSLINRRASRARGRRSGAMGVIVGILGMIYGLAAFFVMERIMNAAWLYGPASDLGWELVVKGCPILLPLAFTMILWAAHVTLAGLGYGFIMEILGQTLLAGLCAAIFMDRLPVIALVVYGAAGLMIMLAILNRILWGIARGRARRGRAPAAPPAAPPPGPQVTIG